MVLERKKNIRTSKFPNRYVEGCCDQSQGKNLVFFLAL